MSIQFMSGVLVACGLFWSMATGVSAQATTAPATSSTESSARLVSAYTEFAGSQSNATALVQGLQSGQSVTLTPTGTPSATNAPVTFTPATSKLGAGDVNIALALAKAELKQAGISNPTPAQLAAALNGGTVTRADGTQVQIKGVLAERKSGMGWGQIANSMGVKLGALVSASKTEHAGKKEPHESNETGHTKKGEHEHAEASSHAKSGETSHAGGNGGGGGGGGGGHGGGKK